MELTDEQWRVLEPLIGAMPRRADGRGRPWRSSREVLNGEEGRNDLHIWCYLAHHHEPLPVCTQKQQIGEAAPIDAAAVAVIERGGGFARVIWLCAEQASQG
jgi:hypothetical protein